MSRRGLRTVIGVLLVGLAGGAGFMVADRRADPGTPPVIEVATGTADVRRVTVAERRQIAGTLGYEGAYTVIASGPGTITRLPAVGAVVRCGQAAYEVDGKPVMLMYGDRPVWRRLEPGMTDGADVLQLETNLSALGYGAGMTVDQHFTASTYQGVRRWQAAAGLAVTGAVPLGQIVFVPAAVRVGGHDVQWGTRAEPGAAVEHGTSDRPAVAVQLSPQLLPSAKVGDPVVVTLPDGKTRSGRIAAIGAITTAEAQNGGGSSGAPASTAPVTVQMEGAPTTFLDQSQVQVAITVAAHENVLAVQISALNAVANGRYEVIVVDGTATRRVPVQTGLFDEFAGLAEVSGPGLAAGQKVQVPQ